MTSACTPGQVTPCKPGEWSITNGTVHVTYTATDMAGLKATCTFTVNVEEASASTPASLNEGIVIPVAAGCGALLLVVVLVFAAITRARRESVRREIRRILTDLNLTEVDEGKRPLEELKASDLVMLDVLGQGAFGSVQKAIYSHSARQRAPDYLVAVKSCHADSAAEGRRALLEEATIMSQFQHPNVLQLIGIVADDPVMVIIEFMEFGALVGILQSKTFEETRRLNATLDCARGLAYLHARRFVHSDVAARIVLVNSAWQCKISDFGLSRDTEKSSYYRSKGGNLPIRWTAPEALEHSRFNEATDVWAFGILAYEIWTQGATPYKDWGNQRVWVEVTSGTRLPRPEYCSALVYEEVMLACWTADPILRPHFATLVVRLETVAGKAPLLPRAGPNSIGAANGYHGDHAAYVTLVRADRSTIVPTAALDAPMAIGETSFGFPSTDQGGLPGADLEEPPRDHGYLDVEADKESRVKVSYYK